MERTKVNIKKDDENNIHPDLFLPYHWTSTMFSAIEYRTDKELKEKAVDGTYDSSHQETTLDHEVFKLHLFNYNINQDKYSYSAGVVVGQEKFDKTQVGYATSGADTINFDQTVNIIVQNINLRGDVTRKKLFGPLDARLGVSIAPSSKLTVEQDTTLTGLLNSTGTGDSTETLDTSYEITLDLEYSVGSFALGLDTRYQHLPLKYSLQLAKNDNTFEEEKFDVIYKITEYKVKLYWSTDIFGGLKPLIGYGSTETKEEDKLDNGTDSRTENVIIIGFDKRF